MRVLRISRDLTALWRSDDRRTIHTHTAPYHSEAALHTRRPTSIAEGFRARVSNGRRASRKRRASQAPAHVRGQRLCNLLQRGLARRQHIQLAECEDELLDDLAEKVGRRPPDVAKQMDDRELRPRTDHGRAGSTGLALKRLAFKKVA